MLFYSYKIETVSVNNIFRYIPIYRILLSLDIFIYISPFFNIFVCVTVFKKCRRKEVLSLRKFESSDSSLLSFPSLLLCFYFNMYSCLLLVFKTLIKSLFQLLPLWLYLLYRCLPRDFTILSIWPA